MRDAAVVGLWIPVAHLRVLSVKSYKRGVVLNISTGDGVLTQIGRVQVSRPKGRHEVT